MNKRCSVIFCTYNREKYIYNAMKSIVEQEFPVEKYEIVLINNNSTDNTEQICIQFQKDFPQVDFNYIVEINQGLSYARNRGIKESKGELLVFVDDDATVFEHYLSSIDNFFKMYPNAVACGGPIKPVYETGKPMWLSYYTNILIGGALYYGERIVPFKNGKFPGGGNSAFKYTVFGKYGLFNVELGRKGSSLIGAEEKDLYDRLARGGEQFYYLPQMGIYHYISETKLTKDYFKNLTYSMGKSERIRTKSVSYSAYLKRLFAECIKWIASVVLFIGYTLTFRPAKGVKLLQFRKNVSSGLLGF